MPKSSHLRRLSYFLRRFPKLLLLPYYLYRFIQTKYTLGVVGVVLNEQGEVLLVEHVFHPLIPWGLPGGWLGYNENPERAVEREFLEELGLVVQVTKTLRVEKSDYNHINIAYLCEIQEDSAIENISYELLNFRWYKPTELPLLHTFHRLAITDAIHILKNGVVL